MAEGSGLFVHFLIVGQALKGNNCGGRDYGYKHVPVEHLTEKDEYGRPKIVAVPPGRR